jgi:hypothetical protein
MFCVSVATSVKNAEDLSFSYFGLKNDFFYFIVNPRLDNGDLNACNIEMPALEERSRLYAFFNSKSSVWFI